MILVARLVAILDNEELTVSAGSPAAARMALMLLAHAQYAESPLSIYQMLSSVLSERSTAQLRNFLFTICGGMPQNYYLQAGKMQGICVDVTDGILSVKLPALLPKKTRTEGFKFLQPALHAALIRLIYWQNCWH